jgi:hypothetical protein
MDKVTVKIPSSNNGTWYFLNKITILYQTKAKLKNESTIFQQPGSTHQIIIYKGKKVNVVVKEKGYIQYPQMTSWTVITYQHFKVNTLNSKDKIKSVKIIYYDVKGLKSAKTIKGYGKSSLSFKFYDIQARSIYDIVVRYT